MRIPYLVPALLLVAGVSACGESTAAAPVSSSASPFPSPSASPAPSLPRSASASPRPTPDHRPISSTPAQEKGLDLVELIKVTSAHGVVTLHVDRKVMFTGDEARAHNRSDGNPPNDFAIEDPDGVGKELTFVLDPKASLRSTANLNTDPDQNSEHTLTSAQFVRNAHRLQARDLEATVWLRHRDGTDGPVTALAEQFLP